MRYAHGYKAARVVRWRNLEPCLGDCKVGIIPHRHIFDSKRSIDDEKDDVNAWEDDRFGKTRRI